MEIAMDNAKKMIEIMRKINQLAGRRFDLIFPLFPCEKFFHFGMRQVDKWM